MVWVTQEQKGHTTQTHNTELNRAHLKDYLQPQLHNYKIPKKWGGKAQKDVQDLCFILEKGKKLKVYRITVWKRHSWPACSTGWHQGMLMETQPCLLPMQHHCCPYMATASVVQPSVELQNLMTTSLPAARACLAPKDQGWANKSNFLSAAQYPTWDFADQTMTGKGLGFSYWEMLAELHGTGSAWKAAKQNTSKGKAVEGGLTAPKWPRNPQPHTRMPQHTAGVRTWQDRAFKLNKN